MQIHTGVRGNGGNGNGNGHTGNGGQQQTRRVVMPTGQSNPQQTRRTVMTEDGQAQVVNATITLDDVGKTVPVVVSGAPQSQAPSHEERMAFLEREVQRLAAENARMADMRTRGVSMKVSEKGALSLYGLGRFPITAYAETWTKILAMADQIRDFIKGNTRVRDGGSLPDTATTAHLTYLDRTAQNRGTTDRIP